GWSHPVVTMYPNPARMSPQATRSAACLPAAVTSARSATRSHSKRRTCCRWCRIESRSITMPVEKTQPHISVNALAQPLLTELLGAPGQDVLVRTTSQGVRIVDAGIEARSSIAAGVTITSICMGGLGRVAVRPGTGEWPTRIEVASAQPVLACLASQYA